MIYGGIFDYDAKSERLRTVNASLEDPTVWNDPKKAQELGREKKALDGVVVTIQTLDTELADNTELYDMAKEEGDFDSLEHIEAEASKLGGNAVIGVDLDYEVLGSNGSMLMVSCSGTAVVV